MSSVKTKEHQATIKTLQDLIRANPDHLNGEILALARSKGVKTSVFVIAQTRRHMRDRGELKVKSSTNGAHPQPVRNIFSQQKDGSIIVEEIHTASLPKQSFVPLTATDINELASLAKRLGSWKALLDTVRVLALE